MTIKNSKFSATNRSSLNGPVLNGSILNGSRQGGFFNLPNDNIIKTIGVATLLCLVCSVIVSGAAIILKPQQVANKLLDKKRNILIVAGISDDSKTVKELFAQIDTRVVDMSTGEFTDAVNAETFDQRKAANDAEYRVDLSKSQDVASIGAISKYGNVYLLRDGDAVSKIILPIRGYGLWSTMYGFIALESDARTVSGITFYEHGETPGLGGEIENKKWQASWHGKHITDLQGNPELRLVKGGVTESTPNSEYKVDGLAGATLTSNGVSNLIQFWMGEDAFGPFLERVRSGNGLVSMATTINSEKG
jgi:Na+-transporting NADH:ubiquinone oxidoreductase subunit C